MIEELRRFDLIAIAGLEQVVNMSFDRITVGIVLKAHNHIAIVRISLFINQEEWLVPVDAGRAVTDVITDAHNHCAVGLLITVSSGNDGAKFDPAKTLLCRFINDDGSGVFGCKVTTLNNADSHSRWHVVAAVDEGVFEYAAVGFRTCPHGAMTVGFPHQVVREGNIGNSGHLLLQ